MTECLCWRMLGTASHTQCLLRNAKLVSLELEGTIGILDTYLQLALVSHSFSIYEEGFTL